jgi:hypothetical protein
MNMSQVDWFAVFGFASVIISTSALVPYIRDMLRGKTLPLRSTWLIWTVLATMSFLSNVSAGATDSLLFVGVETWETALIFVLSIRFGMGSFLRRSDLHVLAIAACGVLLWWITSNEVWALAIAISVSALGGLVMMVKTYQHPGSETVSCWVLSALAAGCGVISVGRWDPVLLAYPVYLFLLYLGILLAIWLGRRNADAQRRAKVANAPAARPVAAPSLDTLVLTRQMVSARPRRQEGVAGQSSAPQLEQAGRIRSFHGQRPPVDLKSC